MMLRLSIRLLVPLTLATVASMAQAQTAFISSEKDHALTLLDLKSQSVVGTVPTCERPRHLLRMPDGKQMLVICGDSGQADVIDLAARKSVRRVPVGSDPEIADLSADGRTLFVTREEDAEVAVIDLASGKKTGAFKVGEEPEGIMRSPDGKRLYVTSEAASLVHVIDIASGKMLKNIKVGKRPRRFAITPDGAQVWVTNELDASVSIIDAATLEVAHTLRLSLKGARAADITPVGITMTRDGKRAFVSLGKANHVAFVDVPSRQVTATVLVGKRAWGLGLDAAEKTLVVVNGLSDDVTLVDVASAKPLKSVRVGRVPHSALVVE